MTKSGLHKRDHYLKAALLFRDTDLIKVITGVRRCGKSSLLKLIRNEIQDEGISGRSFVELNLESRVCPVSTVDELYQYFKDRLSKQGKTYIFLDEPQRIEGWQDAVNAMRVDFDCDIYLTGSNAYLLSSELSTYLSGRYVEIKMLPLSFSEYLDFCGVSFPEDSSVTLGPKGNPLLFDDVFERYLEFGGMPGIASLDITQEMHSLYMSGIYDAVLTRDVLNRERNKNQSRVTNPALLQKIASYMADNIGNQISAASIANTLTSAGTKTSHVTVSSYLQALIDAFLFYQASRYDLHGKTILKTNPKNYIVDLGLRSFLSGYRKVDTGRMFENAVYFQLLYEGYSVHVGKLYQKEVDFVAIKDGERMYIQVTDDMTNEETRKREIAPLNAIKDGFQKVVIVRRGLSGTDSKGIKILTAKEFFLKE